MTSNPTHRMHYIGRPECVVADCEPDMPSGFVPCQSWREEEAEKAARRRPLIARRIAGTR